MGGKIIDIASVGLAVHLVGFIISYLFIKKNRIYVLYIISHKYEKKYFTYLPSDKILSASADKLGLGATES